MIVGAVVLAAGKSKRMGQNKLLLTLNHKTLIENVLDALSDAGVNEQVIVLGHDIEPIIQVIRPRLGRIKIALNLAEGADMASSFQTGLQVLPWVEAAFLVLGDQPILDPNLLLTMMQKIEGNPEALIVSPIHKGKKGHPLLFRRQLFGEILSLKGNQTVRDVVHSNDDRLVTFEAPEWTIMDIDTAEDYERMRRLIKNGPAAPPP